MTIPDSLYIFIEFVGGNYMDVKRFDDIFG